MELIIGQPEECAVTTRKAAGQCQASEGFSPKERGPNETIEEIS